MEASSEVERSAGKLLRSEWMIIGCLLCLMVTFGVVAKVKAAYSSEELDVIPLPVHAMCEVTIEGTVSKPGVFCVPPGTPLKTVLKKSGLRPSSNLREVDLSAKVETATQIYIPELAELLITVQREGIAALCYAIPVGTKVSELKSFIPCSKEEARKFFKSRRLVKDREVFVLPKEEKFSY